MEDEILELLSLGFDSVDALRLVGLEVVGLLHRVRRETWNN